MSGLLRKGALAGVLDAGGRLEAQGRIGLQHQRGGKILRREAGIEMPEHDLVDIGGGDAGIGQRLIRHAHDQAVVDLTPFLCRRKSPAGG